jgi:hypothetical protein
MRFFRLVFAVEPKPSIGGTRAYEQNEKDSKTSKRHLRHSLESHFKPNKLSDRRRDRAWLELRFSSYSKRCRDTRARFAPALGQGFSLARRNSTSELELGIHDKRSSVQMAACGECSSGLSIEHVVTSTYSESSASWIKIGVPQQPANDLSRSACWTCFNCPDNTRKSSLRTETHATPGAPLAFRQSMQ